MPRRFVVTLLIGLPLVAIADTPTTYHCEGEQTTEGGLEETVSTTKEHVAQDYTIDLQMGRYWDWKERVWRPIHSIEPHTLVLTEETVGPGMHGWWRVTIDRDVGAWSVIWAGGQHTTAIRGQCKPASLRQPPR